MKYICRIPSPVGELTAASDGTNIVGLWIKGQKYYADKMDGEIEERELPVFAQVKEWMECFFSGKEPDFIPPLAPQGSLFRQTVWKILLEIPYGQVATYGQIARQLERQKNAPPTLLSEAAGKHMSAQAVGGAVGHNPISIIIPCHRVVGSDGSLTGYAGGISIKVKLLELEKTPMDGLYMPKKGTAL